MSQSTPVGDATADTGVILRDTYPQAGLPDPVLDSAFVLEVARRHAPGARAVETVDESGGEARTYMVDASEGPLVVKTQRPHRRRARTSLEKEAVFLRHLATLPGEPLAVPRVLGHGRAAHRELGLEIEYTVMTRIPGEAVRRVELKGEARRAALAELGAVLRRVHGAPQAALLATGLFPGDVARTDLATRLEAPALEAARRVSVGSGVAQLGADPEELVRRAIAALPAESPRVALHSNPSAVHTFVDLDGGAFTGLIDFGDAYVSHPALDLRRWESDDDRVAVLGGYERSGAVDADFRRVWRIACALADLATLGASDAAGAPEEREGRAARIRSLLEDVI